MSTIKLLAIETCTEACSAALWIEGTSIERFAIVPQGHAGLLLRMVEEVLAESGLGLSALDALAFSRGPGSFTGVRIGAGVVQGLALGAELPVVAVSSLAALAQGTQVPRVLAAIDARMDEVYWGGFERDAGGIVHPVDKERVCRPEQVSVPPGAGWVGVGSGWDRHAARLRAVLGHAVSRWLEGRSPHARDVAILGADAYRRGAAVMPELALPVYLRDEVAKKGQG